MRRINNKTLGLIIMIICCFFFQTTAYSIISSSLTITGDAIARIRNNVRINDFRIHEVSDGVISSYEEFSKFTTNSNVTLPNSDSYIIYKLVIGNYENVEMQLSNITGLSSNLTYELIDYALHDMICDTTNKCTSGAEMTIYIKIKYASYDSLNTNYNVNLNYEFREFSNTLMIGTSFNTTIPTTATHLVFTDEKPAAGVALTDVSAEQDMGVVGYLDGTTYKVSTRRTGIMPVANALSSNMFNGSTLTSIDLNNLDTSNVVNMAFMFFNCANLTELNVSTIDTRKVESFSYFAGSCINLTHLDLSNFDTSSATSMESMFNDCRKLISVDVSNFNTSNVTTMKRMFAFCNELTELDVSNFDTSSVTDMYSMFADCTKITYINVSKFNTSNVTDMYSMFRNCMELTDLDVSSFDTSKVTNMFKMFFNCKKITHLDLSGFTTSNVKNMSFMFYYCSGLTSLDLNSFDTSNVTMMESMFQYCTSLNSLNISSFNTKSLTDASAIFAQNFMLQSIDLSNFDTTNVTDMYAMFCGNVRLEKIYVGENWNVTNVSTSGDMFYNCDNLPNFDSTVVDVTKAYVGDGGYLSYKTSNMTINGTTYEFRPGMTWGEWYDSDYNTFLYDGRSLEKYTSYFFITYGDGYYLCNSSSNSDIVSPDDVIISDKVYYIVSRAK